ncbi:helix-turn-helix domain-containing protein [Chryseobacterium arthrosphaerae]|uniref:HTH araC/xylS-type domain-containing protein n=1 Tax=Chryseobacterium arthrosphaerae TaxID=651561 RepID=A0A1B8ZS70_9FLAO|nr:helix-turn-helix domain-containing protein [Chryseobacterium arthrosphaerae]OCA74429.1 hypothetical protein BBI00_08845 [Chryseobacterium arthrosphaerae]
MKKLKNILNLQDDGFKKIMSYYDPKEYNKKNFNDFYIHGLSDDTYEIKMPLPPHRQSTHSIILVTKGYLIAGSGFDHYTVEQKGLIAIPAGQITSLMFMSGDIEGFYLHFSVKYLSQTAIDFLDWLIKPYIRFEDTEIKHLLVLLRRMQELNRSDADESILKSYLTTFLLEMKQSNDFRTRVNFTASEMITSEFKKLLNYYVTKHNSVRFYAEKLNVTTNHLNKSVKSTLAKPASALINEMLVLEAKVLMQKSHMSINEIAAEIGFEDISYFGRFFKKHTGSTPTDYRKLIDLSE